MGWLKLSEHDTDSADHHFLAASTPPASPSSRKGGHGDLSEFYTLPQDRVEAIHEASEELHRMFTAATARVLEDDTLLAKFEVPKELYGRLRDSFAAHQRGATPQPVAGRLDLAVSDDEIKVYEYNADSASCLYECGSSQGRWADAVGLRRTGIDAGASLYPKLTEAWRRSGIPAGQRLHIMIDDNEEEAYHGRYMAQAARAAGIETRLVTRLQGLRYGERGEILDADGVEVRFVWKSWSWETVFDDFNAQLAAQRTPGTPTLSGVLLSEEVTVWEPLWTTLTNNKAILPVLWEMYPDHPYLLRAEFSLSAALKASPEGYVAKPIVGRCGSNVTMVGQDGAVIEQLGGQFDAKEVVYQELRSLPRIHGKSVLVCPWVVSGECGGLVLRVDKGLITTVDSPIECLRVVPCDEPAPAAAEVERAVPTQRPGGVRRNFRRHFRPEGCGRCGGNASAALLRHLAALSQAPADLLWVQ